MVRPTCSLIIGMWLGTILQADAFATGSAGSGIVATLPAAGYAAATEAGLANDAELVRRLAGLLRDDLPELARFRELLGADAGDSRAMNAAADELVAFFAARWKPSDPSSTTQPSSGSRSPGSRRKPSESPAAAQEKARRVTGEMMQHIFRYGAISHQFGDRIDWDLPVDYEWRVSLNRLGFLSSMTIVARTDRDETVAAEWQRILRSWVEDCPLPPRRGDRYETWQKWPTADGVNWRSLDAAIRVRHLRYMYGMLADVPGVTRNTRLQLIYSIWQHIDYLKDDDWDRANWLSLVIDAVSVAGTEWTMFRDAPRWRDAARSLVEANVLRDIHPDGKEIEDSTGYIQFALSHLIQSYLRLRNAGVAFSHQVDERLRRSLDFSAWVAFPDGQSPMVGDSDRSTPYVPARYWEELGRPDVGYVVTGGQEGTQPREASRGWPDGGWYVMRSPWATRPFAQDLHMVFKASPGGPHGHLDQLSVTAYAYGRPLLIDPGRLNYRKEGGRDFRCTAAHNTVVVDGLNQSSGSATVARWEVRPAYDFVDASHQLYRGVVHRRRVLFVKDAFWLVVDSLSSGGEHLYEQRWHFPEELEIRRESDRVLAESPAGPGIALIPLNGKPDHELRPFDYDIAYVWDQRTASRGWQWSARGTQEVFATLLVPYAAKGEGRASVLAAEVKAETVGCTVRLGDRTWRVLLGPDGVAECDALGGH